MSNNKKSLGLIYRPYKSSVLENNRYGTKQLKTIEAYTKNK